MTKDQIQARIDELMKIGKQAESQIHAINGALQECNYWMEQLAKGEEVKPNQKCNYMMEQLAKSEK